MGLVPEDGCVGRRLRSGDVPGSPRARERTRSDRRSGRRRPFGSGTSGCGGGCCRHRRRTERRALGHGLRESSRIGAARRRVGRALRAAASAGKRFSWGRNIPAPPRRFAPPNLWRSPQSRAQRPLPDGSNLKASDLAGMSRFRSHANVLLTNLRAVEPTKITARSGAPSGGGPGITAQGPAPTSVRAGGRMGKVIFDISRRKTGVISIVP